ncbi:hypothetical protein [Micromonospora aurantiaca (nom. illeg.)]|uniref:hypothetical protein n=1 Tax=Micromonospora aurantiaca (nom. illeg.) TaxID=47850 RepID=UPI0035B03C9F
MENGSNERRIATLRRHRRLVWVLFWVAMLGTLAGNVAGSNMTPGGIVAGALPPLAWWGCSEVLFRVRDVPERVAVGGGVALALIGGAALVTSYVHVAEWVRSVGWTGWSVWVFPFFLDAIALMMTVYLLGIGHRITEIEVEQRVAEVTPRRGRPRKAPVEPEPAPVAPVESEAAPAPERSRSAAEVNADAIRDRFPDEIPSPKQVREAFGWGASRADAALKVLRSSLVGSAA